MDFLPQEAISGVVKDGAWACAFLLMFFFSLFLVVRLLGHGKGSTDALVRTAVALEGLSLRIDGALKPKGGQE